MTCNNEIRPAGGRPNSRFIAPAALAFAGLMLAAAPVTLGTSGLVASSALAATNHDFVSPDTTSAEFEQHRQADQRWHRQVEHRQHRYFEQR